MPTLGERKRVTSELKSWLDDIAQYDRVFADWETRSKKILDRYSDKHREEQETLNRSSRFNILWSNVQTLSAATFARLPKPDVSRRFKDNDPIGRIASLILERGLEYEIQHYGDYRAALRACVADRFLGGRATAWVRYEPSIKPKQEQVTDDVEEPAEVLDYECAKVDYVHWRDFGHSVARTWEEVPRVWRRVYMTQEALEARFGEETAKLIPMDASPLKDEAYPGQQIDLEKDRACIFEGWDKNTKKAVWFSKGVKDFLDERDDPLGLEDFFPCPRPLYATLVNESLIPVPDFALYQDQAIQLDILSTRIDGLIKALQVRGVYNSAIPALKRLFSEAENTDLIPVENWNAFAEKAGLKGAIDIVEIKPIAEALNEAYTAFEQLKMQVYEITRISDLMRGVVNPEEKLGQSQLKTQYGNLGLRSYQEQVAVFATELLQIKAQVMCNKFDPQTMLQISASDQLVVTDTDVLAAAPQLGQPLPQPMSQPGMQPGMGQPPMMQGQPMQGQPPMQAGGMPGPQGGMKPQPVPAIKMLPQEAKQKIVLDAALKLLMGDRATNPEAPPSAKTMRSFRVDVEADSLVHLDEQMEKKSRMEFLEAQAGFLQQLPIVLQSGPAAPALVPLVGEMWKFAVSGFKVGKAVEGAFDEAIQKLKELTSKPPAPRPDPEMMKIEQQAKADAAKQVFETEKATAELAAERERVQLEAQTKAQELQAEDQREQRRLQIDQATKQFEIQAKFDFEQWKFSQEIAAEERKAQLEAQTKIEIARITAESSERMKEKEGQNAERTANATKPPVVNVNLPSGNKKITRTKDGYESRDA